MLPLIIGGGLLVGGTVAGMIGNKKATKAGQAVLRAEGARQRVLDGELQRRSDQLLAASNPVAAMGDELALGGNYAADLNAQAGAIQAGALASGGVALAPGRSNRIRSAATLIARSRAAGKKGRERDLTRDQFALDRSRIQQRSQDSQAIAAIEAEDASRVGSGWRAAGGLAQGLGMGTMMAG